jgi:hypothetical protein
LFGSAIDCLIDMPPCLRRTIIFGVVDWAAICVAITGGAAGTAGEVASSALARRFTAP